MIKQLGSIFLGLLFSYSLSSQIKEPAGTPVDRILAVVGEEILLQSELQDQITAYLESQEDVANNSKCEIFQELVLQKLLLNQAAADSIEVSEAQIQGEIERRLSYFISQFGSQQQLEEFYGKTLVEIKAEFYEPIKEQLLVQQMQSKVMSSSRVTPADVKAFYRSIPQDSLPWIESEVEIGQIVKRPEISEEEKERTIKKLKELRQRVLDGEDFGTLAFLYSEDPGSARENGELGFMSRGQLVPEFTAVAFALEIGETSEIVETEYGYHIIQMIEKKGQEANFKHILLSPKVKTSDMTKAKAYLDSLRTEILNKDSVNFGQWAKLHSDDDETKNANGIITNPITGGPKFEMNQLSQVDPTLVYTIENMEEGEISEPVLMQTRDGKRAYRIVKLISISKPHVANLRDDYQRLTQLAEANKKSEVLGEWVVKVLPNYFVKIDDEFKSCTFTQEWGLVQQ